MRAKEPLEAPKPQSSRKMSLERQPGELPTPLTGIRAHCLGCCEDSVKEVALCTVTHCPLWPWRFRSRARARRIVAQERALGAVKGKWWAERLDSYTQQAYYLVQQAAQQRQHRP